MERQTKQDLALPTSFVQSQFLRKQVKMESFLLQSVNLSVLFFKEYFIKLFSEQLS